MAWIILDDLQDLRDVVIVRKPEDVGKPELIDGEMSIRWVGDTEYEQQHRIESPYPLALPADGNTSTWTTLNRAPWIYTGDVAAIRDLNATGTIEFKGAMEFQAPNAAILNVSNGVNPPGWSIQGFGLPRLTNCKSLGTVKGASGYNMFFGSITDFEDGIILEDLSFNEHNLMFVDGNNNQVLNYDGQTTALTQGQVVTGTDSNASGVLQFDRNAGTSGKLTLSGVIGVFIDNEPITDPLGGAAVADGVIENMVIFTTQGVDTFGPVNFIGLDWFSEPNETLLDIKQEIETNVDTISLLNNRAQITEKPTAFAPDSLDQTDVKVVASDNTFFPDSTTKAKLEITGNTLVTDIINANDPEFVNAVWSDGTLEERMCFQDFVTFDNTTNTLTPVNNPDGDTTFSHGLSNGDVITLVENGGLPTGLIDRQDYFVINVTATTFQISLTLGGAAVTFPDDGTPPNYYCHVTGMSASGWVIYIGIQDVSLVVQGWIGLDISGAAQESGAQLIKTDSSFNEILAARGSKVTVQQGKGQSTTVSDLLMFSTFEGVRQAIEGRSGNTDLIATDADMTFTKA